MRSSALRLLISPWYSGINDRKSKQNSAKHHHFTFASADSHQASNVAASTNGFFERPTKHDQRTCRGTFAAGEKQAAARHRRSDAGRVRLGQGRTHFARSPGAGGGSDWRELLSRWRRERRAQLAAVC